MRPSSSTLRPGRAIPVTLLIAAGALGVGLGLGPAWEAAAAAGSWQENPQSRVRLVSPYAVAPATGEVRLGLQFTLTPGWHVYWKNSGDAGYPPALDFSPTPEVREAELLWPVPERYELPGDLVAFGYEREVVYPIRARLDAGGAAAVTLAADLDYVVCEVDCVPYSYRLTLDQPVAGTDGTVADPDTAPLVAAWWDRVPAPVEEIAGLATRGALVLADPDRPALVVDIDGPAARNATRPELFLAVSDLFTSGTPELTPTGAGIRFRVPLAWRERPPEPLAAAEFAWTVAGLGPAAGEGAETVAFEARRTVTPAAVADTSPAGPNGESGAGSPDSQAILPGPAWLLAVLALVAFAGALYLWGIVGPAGGPERTSRTQRRESLGFAALAAVVALLYALGPRIGAERLAFVQLALLAGALAGWLHRRAAGRLARAALSLGLVLLAALVVWLTGAPTT